MGRPVVTVASGGLPVVDATAFGKGTPVTEDVNLRGIAVTKVATLGLPVCYETFGIAAPVVPTALNPSDKDTHITLSGGNLTATGTAGWTGLVRAVSGKPAGKFYWETTFNATQSNSGVGLAIGSLSVSTQTFVNAGTGKCGLVQNGIVYVDGATTFTVGGTGGTSISFGTITSGVVICVAVDLTAQLIWFRLGVAGNWNNVAGRNPATGVGGVSISTITTAYPTICFGGADTIIVNFGATAFTGAVPSGFTSGWTA